jgi:hypothetical protein
MKKMQDCARHRNGYRCALMHCPLVVCLEGCLCNNQWFSYGFGEVLRCCLCFDVQLADSGGSGYDSCRTAWQI